MRTFLFIGGVACAVLGVVLVISGGVVGNDTTTVIGAFDIFVGTLCAVVWSIG